MVLRKKMINHTQSLAFGVGTDEIFLSIAKKNYGNWLYGNRQQNMDHPGGA